MADEFNYYIYDPESGKTTNFEDEEQYKQSLFESGFHKNTKKIGTEGQNVNDLKYAFFDMDTSYDRNDEENTKYALNNKNELFSKDKENYKLSLSTPIPIKVNKQQKHALSASEIFCVIIASIICPIIGGCIVYNWLSKNNNVNDSINEEQKNTDIQQKIDNDENEKNENEEEEEEKEQENDDLYQSEHKNIPQSENLSNLNNHNNRHNQVIA
jgi:hypothetical protein